MVAALPCAIWKERIKQKITSSIASVQWLVNSWGNENVVSFDTCPYSYISDLRRAQRADTLKMVQELIKELEYE